MVRDSDSGEERHDRFKSERNVYSTKQRSPERRSRNSDERRKDRRKKERSRSRSRRSRDRKSRTRTRSRSYERKRSRERRSDDKKRRDDRRRHSEEKRVDKRVDTFKDRFERRRHSEDDSRQEETIFYWDKTPSPERESCRHKKKKNGEKERKHKEKKKSSKSIEKHIEKEVVNKSRSKSIEKQLDKEIGPALPSGLELRQESEKENGNENIEDTYGPILPLSDLIKTDSIEEGELSSPKKRIFGPALPERINVDDGDDSYGPALPPDQDIVDSGDEDIGPLPEGINGGRSQLDLDRRAALIKYQLENKELTGAGDAVKREEWMTELPEAKRVTLGLGARKFRTKEGPDMSDRSSWSDTPAAKEHKKKLSSLGLTDDAEKESDERTRKLDIAARDKEMEKMAKSGKKRDKSLLELHQKEIKKKKKKEDKEKGTKKEERRPFNREVDLQTNRFDEAQKKSIIKKAQLLDTRFSSGESKFL